MLDWPGRMATTVFIGGCNLACAFCHNPDLICPTPPEMSRLDDLMEHCHARRSWIDGVVITGGEPTCDPALFSLLDEFAAMCVPVKLDTNGTNPEALASILDSGLVAYVAIDIKALPERYAQVTGMSRAWDRVGKSVDILLHSTIPHEFRTTAFPEAVDLDDLEKIAELIGGGDHYALQQFRPDHTLDPQARDVRPYDGDDLRRAAEACAKWIPTTIRGA